MFTNIAILDIRQQQIDGSDRKIDLGDSDFDVEEDDHLLYYELRNIQKIKSPRALKSWTSTEFGLSDENNDYQGTKYQLIKYLDFSGSV